MDLSTHSLTPGGYVPPKRHTPRGIRRLIRVSKRDAPSPFQRPTSTGLLTEAAPKCISGRTSYLGVRLAFHLYPQVIPALCNVPGFGPPRACSPRFSLPMGSSPRFGSVPGHLPPFRTRFRSGSACHPLSLATKNHSSAHSTKGTPSPNSVDIPAETTALALAPGRRLPGSDRPGARDFRIYFTPLAGVLFTVPSRYWFAIGRRRYLALGGGPPRFPPDSACPAVLTQRAHTLPRAVAYGALTHSGPPFQRGSADPCKQCERSATRSRTSVQPRRRIGGSLCHDPGLGSSPFARRYSGNPLSSSRY
jgi:hypothetical protein